MGHCARDQTRKTSFNAAYLVLFADKAHRQAAITIPEK
jgi:hypothetical protein